MRIASFRPSQTEANISHVVWASVLCRPWSVLFSSRGSGRWAYLLQSSIHLSVVVSAFSAEIRLSRCARHNTPPPSALLPGRPIGPCSAYLSGMCRNSGPLPNFRRRYRLSRTRCGILTFRDNSDGIVCSCIASHTCAHSLKNL